MKYNTEEKSNIIIKNNKKKNEFLESLRNIENEETKLLKLQKQFRNGEIKAEQLTKKQKIALSKLYDEQISRLPPEVMIASLTGRFPVISTEKAFSSSTSARRFCLVREFACIWGSISKRRRTTGIMLRGSRSVSAFSMARF